MSVEVHGGPTIGWFYCTTSETEFGPRCRSADEAEDLAFHIWRTRGEDIRAVCTFGRYSDLDRLRAGLLQEDPTHPSLRCFCGSGLPASITTQWGKPIRSQCRACNGTEPPK